MSISVEWNIKPYNNAYQKNYHNRQQYDDFLFHISSTPLSTPDLSICIINQNLLTTTTTISFTMRDSC